MTEQDSGFLGRVHELAAGSAYGNQQAAWEFRCRFITTTIDWLNRGNLLEKMAKFPAGLVVIPLVSFPRVMLRTASKVAGSISHITRPKA